MAQDHYDASNAKVLTGLAGVRQNADVYVGSLKSIDNEPSEALNQILQEILSNAIDEAREGYGKQINIVIHPDNSVSVQDFGRGWPRGKNFHAIRDQMTKINASSKFDNKAYKHSVGMHGMGVKATNALSKYIQADVIESDHTHYFVKYHFEHPIEEKIIKKNDSNHTGTTVTFLPDNTIFDVINWDDQQISHKLQQNAYLNPKVKFTLTDERKPAEEDDTKHDHYYHEWYSENGLSDYANSIAQDVNLVDALKEPITLNDSINIKGASKKDQDQTFNIQMSASLIYANDDTTTILSFVNGVETIDNGFHVDGAKQGLYQAFKSYNDLHHVLNKTQSIDSQDTRSGLIMILSTTIPVELLDWDNQSKTKLRSVEAKSATKAMINRKLTQWLSDHVQIADDLINDMAINKAARIEKKKKKKALREANKTKKKKDSLFVSDKLKEARSNDPQKRELFITEGDSAASGLAKGRDPETQAIFPIRGKILNVEDRPLSRVVENHEISTIASVLGAGIGPTFDPDDIQYNKVLLASDADPDGYNIRNLLITLFYKFFPGLIEQGHLYYVNAPLFKISHYKKGKQINNYVYNETERDQVVKKLKAKHIKTTVSRFKGLGEMSTEESKRTLLSPKTRYLTQVRVNDHHEAHQSLELASGKKAAPRQHWIVNNVDFDATTE